MAPWTMHIAKEAYKFSSAHMTVFPDGTKEALHGHNYRVSIDVDLCSVAFSEMICFSLFKRALKPLCDAWDEKLLIAKQNPFLKLVKHESRECEFFLCGKRYVLPGEEVVLLDLDNITTETLAYELARQLIQNLRPEELPTVSGFTIRIDENSGQGASFHSPRDAWRK